jgi:hypothetical protein
MINAWFFGFFNPIPIFAVIGYFLIKFCLFALTKINEVKSKSILLVVLGIANIVLFIIAVFATMKDVLSACEDCHSYWHLTMAGLSLVTGLSIEIGIHEGCIKK